MADIATTPRNMTVPLVALAVGAAVALALGIFGRVHDPTIDGTTTLGFDTVIDMKVVVTTVIGVLVVLQVIGALLIYALAFRGRNKEVVVAEAKPDTGQFKRPVS